MHYSRHFFILIAILTLHSCGSGTKILQRSEKETSLAKKKALEYFNRGSVLQMQGKPLEAILEFQQAVRYDSSAGVQYALAKNYYAIGKTEFAEEYAKKSFELDSNNMESCQLLAEILVAEDKVEDALPCYEILHRNNPSDKTKFQLAQLYEEIGRTDKALALYSTILSRGKDRTILLKLVDIYKRLKSDEDYVRAVERLYQSDPDNLANAAVLMQSYAERNEFAKSDEIFRNMKSRFPMSSLGQPCLIMSDFFLVNDQLDKLDSLMISIRKSSKPEEFAGWLLLFGQMLVRDSSQNAQKFIPNFLLLVDRGYDTLWKLPIVAGELADMNGQKDSAFSFYSRALAFANQDANIPVQVAQAHFNNKRLDSATAILLRYEKVFQTTSFLAFYRGILFANSDSLRLAIAAFRTALSINPRDSDSWANMGLMYDRIGNVDSSDQCYENALIVNPRNPLANNNYAYTLSVRNIKLDQAEAMARIAVEQDRSNASYLDTYGWVLYQKNDLANAAKFIERATKTGRASATVWEHYGDILKRLGRDTEAIRAWKKALELDPNKSSTINRLESPETK